MEFSFFFFSLGIYRREDRCKVGFQQTTRRYITKTELFLYHHAPATVAREKGLRCPLDRRLGRLQGRCESGNEKKNVCPQRKANPGSLVVQNAVQTPHLVHLSLDYQITKSTKRTDVKGKILLQRWDVRLIRTQYGMRKVARSSTHIEPGKRNNMQEVSERELYYIREF
jgi:hypothetical protein